MRKLLPFLLACPLLAQDCWYLDRCVEIDGAYSYLRRTEIRDLTLVDKIDAFLIINQTLPTTEVVDTEGLTGRLGWESAARGRLRFLIDPCSTLELSYTYIAPWNASKTVTGDNSLLFPFKDPAFAFDYIFADKAKASYCSWLETAELNYWRHVTPQRINYFSFSWLASARAFYLKEDFDLAFTKGAATSNYTIETTNFLIGPQLAFRLELNPASWFTWYVEIKGAGLVNQPHSKVFLGDRNNTVTLAKYKKSKLSGSWLIEGYGQIALHFSSHLDLYFGYQGFLLSGLALAPEQRKVENVTKRHISTSGQIVIDGFSIGLNMGF